MRDEKLQISVGLRMKQKRIEKGYTQMEFAKKVGYTSKSTVSLIENGKRDISTSKYIKIANILGTSVDYLLGLEKK